MPLRCAYFAAVFTKSDSSADRSTLAPMVSSSRCRSMRSCASCSCWSADTSPYEPSMAARRFLMAFGERRFVLCGHGSFCGLGHVNQPLLSLCAWVLSFLSPAHLYHLKENSVPG